MLRAFTSGHADSQNSWRCTLVSWSSPKARRKTFPGSRCGHANQLHLFPKCLHRRKGLLKFGPAFLLTWHVARVAGPHGQWTQLFPTFTPVRQQVSRMPAEQLREFSDGEPGRRSLDDGGGGKGITDLFARASFEGVPSFAVVLHVVITASSSRCILAPSAKTACARRSGSEVFSTLVVVLAARPGAGRDPGRHRRRHRRRRRSQTALDAAERCAVRRLVRCRQRGHRRAPCGGLRPNQNENARPRPPSAAAPWISRFS